MTAKTFAPTQSQRAAIEAPLGPTLVLAGPGAGKTFCLIERIKFLIERQGLDPARICAFTFTNKAAEEIGGRLDALGPAAQLVNRGTIHRFCADLLRRHGHHEGLDRGFGIADENYQRAVLGRLGQPARFHSAILNSFTMHRLKDFPLNERDVKTYADYVRRLERFNMADFDMLVVKAAHLMQINAAVADEIRARWDYLLVDEFQDLNPRQYEVVRALGCRHRNVFAVGDDEQSIFSWTGADATLFSAFQNDFEIRQSITLRDNHRCPSSVFALATSLVRRNPRSLFTKEDIVATRDTAHPVRAFNFGDDLREAEWLLHDLREDREQAGLRWGDYALLYRRHEIGDALETTLLSAGVPCRLAHGRAIGDDPVVAFVVAALKVITAPDDDVFQEEYLRVVLPPSLLDIVRTRAAEGSGSAGLRATMEVHARSLGRRDPAASKLWRALFALRNLASLGRKHEDLVPLVEELLSQRIGVYRTMLEERHQELRDPADLPDVVQLAERLAGALAEGRMVWVAPMGGAEIPLRALLQAAGFSRFAVGADPPAEAERIDMDACPSAGIALGVFKALQLVATRHGDAAMGDFTAIDIETTDKDVATAEIIDLAAVRVRNGVPVAEWSSLVRPAVPIHAAVTALTGITEADVATARPFTDVWPEFREFCGSDTLVAHNGYRFDFPILERMAQPLGGHSFVTYDTLVLARDLHPGSRKLEDLAHRFGVPVGHAHRALDDSRALAGVFLRLDQDRLTRSRKTALASHLDQLGVALALDESGNRSACAREVAELRAATAVYALGRYSDALEQYRVQRELSGDPALPAVDDLIERLGGRKLLERVRTERTADDRYPQAMARLRRLMQSCDAPLLDGQIAQFLELVALSKHDGSDVHQDRVSLLTLHSTKGLEFSRVYIVGVEDAEVPGSTQHKVATRQETEEARRLIYVGMTRAKDRLILTRSATRADLPTGGTQFLAELGLRMEEG